MTPEVYLVIEAKIKNELENLHALEGELAAHGLDLPGLAAGVQKDLLHFTSRLRELMGMTN